MGALGWPWFGRKDATSTLILTPDYLSGYALGDATSYLKFVKEGYKRSPAAYACVERLASSVPEAIMRWYACDATGEHQLDDYPGRALIQRPNRFQTEYEFWEMTMRFLSIKGNAYWWKQRGNNGLPVALWPLRPDRVEPIIGKGTEVLAGWKYSLDGRVPDEPIAPQDVLHFNYGDPGDATAGILGGIGPLEVCAHDIDIDAEASKLVYALLKNYAMPGVVMTAKGELTPEEASRAKEKFVEKYGDMRRGVPAIIDKDTKIAQLSFNLRQIAMLDIRSQAQSNVCAAFGVPPILANLLVGLEHATYSNMEQARQFFAETTLSDLWKRLGDQVDLDMTPEFVNVYKGKTKYDVPPTARFDTSKVRALAVHASNVAERYWRVYQYGGITKNEMRAAIGLASLASGDVFVQPINTQLVPAGETAEQVAAPASAGRPNHQTKTFTYDEQGRVTSETKVSWVEELKADILEPGENLPPGVIGIKERPARRAA